MLLHGLLGWDDYCMTVQLLILDLFSYDQWLLLHVSQTPSDCECRANRKLHSSSCTWWWSVLISGTLTSYARKSNAVSHGKRSTAFISFVVEWMFYPKAPPPLNHSCGDRSINVVIGGCTAPIVQQDRQFIMRIGCRGGIVERGKGIM